MPPASTHAPSLRRVLLVALSGAALAVTACGTKASFIDGYNQATRPLARMNADVAGATKTGDVASLQRRLKDQATAWDAAGDNVSRLHAPEQAQDEVDRLVAALHTTARDARASGAAAQNGHRRLAFRLLNRFVASAAETASAEQALKTAVEG
jgi:hypothetical protein